MRAFTEKQTYARPTRGRVLFVLAERYRVRIGTSVYVASAQHGVTDIAVDDTVLISWQTPTTPVITGRVGLQNATTNTIINLTH